MTDNISEIILRISVALGVTSQRKLAQALGISPARVTDAKNRKNIPPEWLVKLALDHGINPAWVMTGEGPQKIEPPENGKVVATFEPGDKAKKARLIAQGIRAENRSSELKRIAAWMDNEEEKNPDFGWLFERELMRTHPSYNEFLSSLEEKKRPREDYLVAEPEQKYNNSN